MNRLVKIITIIAVGTAVAVASVYFFWWAVSIYKIRRAEARRLRVSRRTLWRDPGEVEELDFRNGPGGREGAPAPPFQFVEEHCAGSNPCVSVKDALGRVWRVKWGDEVRSETFASRMVWAAGFHVEINYFIPQGEIEGATTLTRARECIGEDCKFKDARFELDEAGVAKMFDEHGWAWDDNPFVGTRELNGFKIMVMLLSNWDNKDVRDVARGSNTAIFHYRLPGGATEAKYLIIDWGATMGKWGSFVFRGKWDCAGYDSQTQQFITGVEGGRIKWGYIGQRTDDAINNISVEDVRWLWQYIGRVTDEQIREGLVASGATAEETECFTKAIRKRIVELKRAADLEDRYRPPSA
jgi:hypothetical protein